MDTMEVSKDGKFLVNPKKHTRNAAISLAPMVLCSILSFVIPFNGVKAVLFLGVIIFSFLSKKFCSLLDKKTGAVIRNPSYHSDTEVSERKC